MTGSDEVDPSSATTSVVATVAPVLERCSLAAERLARLLVPVLSG